MPAVAAGIAAFAGTTVAAADRALPSIHPAALELDLERLVGPSSFAGFGDKNARLDTGVNP